MRNISGLSSRSMPYLGIHPVAAASVVALALALSFPASLAGDVLVPTKDTSALAQPAAPPVMLAELYQDDIDPAGWWVSEKLDGVRAWWDGTHLITRGGHLVQAPGWFTAGLPPVPLDGELWMGRRTFAELSGTVRRLTPDEDAWRRVRYLVFDLPTHPGTFGQRLAALRALLENTGNPQVEPLRQFRVASRAALMEELDRVVRAGGEGLMLHRDQSLYRPVRSADLLKLKPWQDAEARVIGYLPGHGRLEGMLGALVVETADGQRLRLGTGFTDEERRHPPPVGSIVTFRYQGLTATGLPRFARFLRVREEP
jgi:DNA ligase-1